MSSSGLLSGWLDRSVDDAVDHVLGPANASITLVEYGSYDCPHCRLANERIAELRDQFGDRMRYAYRHRPISGSDIARRAAELVEHAPDAESFWKAHVTLMSRSDRLIEDDLATVAADLKLNEQDPLAAEIAGRQAQAKVDSDIASARTSGVQFTPTFFINSRRYEGPWDNSSLTDAMLGRLGHRMRSAALNFASWGPSAGLLLLLATIVAVVITNTPAGPSFVAFWEQPLALTVGEHTFLLSLQHWVNDGLLTIFFLVVGLEIKREFTVGHLNNWRAAALPLAGAVGGMAVPALLYSLLIPAGDWSHGWGVPMATDTAFALALIVMMGSRVPVALRVFLTAAAIIDDIGAIIVVAAFYSGELHLGALAAAIGITAALALLNVWHVYRVAPYMLLGVALWACVHASGLHATLAGVVLALFIPTRPPPNLKALAAQASAIIAAETGRGGSVLRHGLSRPAMRALEAIHDRLDSPADRLLWRAGARSSYLVLPIFALANAGVVLSFDVLHGHEPLLLAIMAGLIIGKPVGMVLAALLAVKLRVALKPDEYSWAHLGGAGALAGIGFTMSLFIAGQAFPNATDFAAAKIAVLTASVIAALLGTAVLWFAARVSTPQTSSQEADIPAD